MTEPKENPPPPSNDFDFDTARVKIPTVYFTSLGTPCQYINICDEDTFDTPSGSDETELSSDDESIQSKDSSAPSITIPLISSSAVKIKTEKLSEDEIEILEEITPESRKWPEYIVQYTDSEEEGELKSNSPITLPNKQPDAKSPQDPRKKQLSGTEKDQPKERHNKQREEALHKITKQKHPCEERHKVKKKFSEKVRYKSHEREYSEDSDDDQRKSKSRKSPEKDRYKPRGRKYSDDSDDDLRKSKKKSPEKERFKSRERRYSDNSADNQRKSIKKSPEKDEYKSRERKHSDEDQRRSSEKKYPVEDQKKSNHERSNSRTPVRSEEPEEKEHKFNFGTTAAFGSYHCQVCDIDVNSEVTYQTHLRGRRHQKNLKAKAVPELAIRSLSEQRIPIRTATPASSSAPIALPQKSKRVRLNVESLIQSVADDYKDGPLPGLPNIIEIRPHVDGVCDIEYYCELCEAKCVPNTIMKHLTGFKHYLRCLKEIDPDSYERYKYTPKKKIEDKIKSILSSYERFKGGRGKIIVEKEDAQHSLKMEPGPSWNEPGPSWRDDGPPPPTRPNDDDDDCQFVSATEHLDTSMSDFYCKACDAHMNNRSMWESHVIGRRHLKNVKKVPGEKTSKIKSVQCTGEPAHLMGTLNKLGREDKYGNEYVIVGLGYLKETQGEAGDLYNCYLCGACTSSFDIVAHLNQVKHKIRYLEEMNSKGQPNSIEQIKHFSGFSAYSKECMINDECRKSLAKYGDGTISVYKSKSMFSPSYSSRP